MTVSVVVTVSVVPSYSRVTAKTCPLRNFIPDGARGTALAAEGVAPLTSSPVELAASPPWAYGSHRTAMPGVMPASPSVPNGPSALGLLAWTANVIPSPMLTPAGAVSWKSNVDRNAATGTSADVNALPVRSLVAGVSCRADPVIVAAWFSVSDPATADPNPAARATGATPAPAVGVVALATSESPAAASAWSRNW